MTAKIIQRSPEWIALRQTKIGGSDISAISGSNPWMSLHDLWSIKTGRREETPPSMAMNHGIMLEPVALGKYNQDSGIDFEPEVIIYEEWDVAMASLDGISPDRKTILEIKCPFKPKSYEMALFGIIPDYYLDQIQWQLMCSNAEKAVYFVYLDETKTQAIEVLPDVKRQQKLLKMAKEFWQSVLEDKEPSKEKGDYGIASDETDNEKVMQIKILRGQIAELEAKMRGLEEFIKEKYPNSNMVFPESGMKLYWNEGASRVDWKEVQKKWEISEEDLEKYRKKSKSFATLR
jgi:putative phage-type endonuclease